MLKVIASISVFIFYRHYSPVFLDVQLMVDVCINRRGDGSIMVV